MKTTLLLSISIAFFSFAISNSQAQCDGDRYLNMIFTEVEVSQATPFGFNIDFQGNEQTLYLDVYEPANDDVENRPLLIMVHGGSFVGGARDEMDVVPLCNDFAKMGYTVASIDYRLGFAPVIGGLEPVLSEAVLRGVHDFRAAVRFFRKTVEEDGNPYNIDPEKITAAGVSAGGFITLHHAYMDQENEIPESIDMTLPGLGGGLEGESGNPGYSSDVIGVVNIAGALKDTSWMETGDEPVCNFHGTNDSTVPFGSDSLFFLEQFFVTEVDGSESVDQKAGEMGIAHCFEIHDGAGHVPHVNNAQYYDTTRAVMSNFLASLVCDEIELDCNYREIETSIPEITTSENSLLKVYPNPARESLRLEWELKSSVASVSICDSRGVVVRQIRGFQLGSDVLNIADLSKGIYILQVESQDGVARKTFVKN